MAKITIFGENIDQVRETKIRGQYTAIWKEYVWCFSLTSKLASRYFFSKSVGMLDSRMMPWFKIAGVP